MKKLIAAALLLVMAGLTVSAQNNAQDKKKYAVYGIAFYNLENLFDTINNNGKYDLEFSPAGDRQWDGRKYWSKIGNMARCISHMTTPTTPNGPAVIGVSEIENRSVLQDLVNAEPIKQWNLQIVHHDSPDKRGVDVGLLFNPRYFRLLNVTNHRLPLERPTRDQMCVTGILGGDTINFIVNHWPSRMGGESLRLAAAALSKSIADSIWALHPNQGVIVMGDLNDDPMNKSCAEVLGGRKKAEDAERHGFFNPWWRVLEHDGIGTLAYNSQWNLFDQIIVSGNLLDDKKAGALSYWKCQVNNFDFLRDTEGNRQGYPLRTYSAGVFLNGYSDHFPTEIFLRKEIKPKH